jgi:hypothetical protein
MVLLRRIVGIFALDAGLNQKLLGLLQTQVQECPSGHLCLRWFIMPPYMPSSL